MLFRSGETKWPIAFESIIFGTQRTRGLLPVPSPTGASISRLEGQGDQAWVVGSTGLLLRRVGVASGQTFASITPNVTPAGGRWSTVHCAGIDGQDILCLLDGSDAGFNRSSYKLAYASESAPEVGWQSVPFSFADGRSRDCTGLTWDPNNRHWILLARRPGTGNEGDASIWRLPLAGGTAVRDNDRTVIDVDTAQGIDIHQSGVLMAVTRTDGNVVLYAYSKGGYWGSPRTKYLLPSGTHIACFTRHARQDDALRMVMLGDGGSFWDVEL